MTLDDIICMAREADFFDHFEISECNRVYKSDLIAIYKFAGLIRAATKEEDAKICDALVLEEDDRFANAIRESAKAKK